MESNGYFRGHKLTRSTALIALGLAAGFGARSLDASNLAAPASVAAAPAAAAPVAATFGADPNIYVGLGQQVIPSVVNISAVTLGPSPGNPQLRGAPDEMLRRFFDDFFGQNGMEYHYRGNRPPGPRSDGQSKESRIPRATALGTGFVIDPSGVILTNNHVVANADEIKIAFTEDTKEKPVSGTVIGRDPDLDVALIRVKTDKKLTALPLGDSDALQVGEYVAAVGNPFGEGHSLTHGIISAKGRLTPEYPLGSWLQTDAPINPGNSGGPLVNLKGQVIGINTAIDARAHGIGFAIPINLVKKVLPELETKGKVVRGYLGVGIADLNPDLAMKIGVKKDLEAPLVTTVYPKSPAEKAGIEPYDVIVEFNGKRVTSGGELTSMVTAVPVGTKVPLKISRHGREQQLELKLGERPGVQQARGENVPLEPGFPSDG